MAPSTARRCTPCSIASTIAIGEVEARDRPAGIGELARLDHLRSLLPASHVTTPPRLLLVSIGGFTPGFEDAARNRGDVELVDLERLNAGD